jgi:hypothetical protein
VSRVWGASSCCLALLLAGTTGAVAAEAPSAGFRVFSIAPNDGRLPFEIRSQALGRPRGFDVLDRSVAPERTLRIRWVAREAKGLEGYRITAAILGGVLDGTAAQWIVKSERTGGSAGVHTYEIQLRVPAAPSSAVTAALEVLTATGPLFVAARESPPSLPLPADFRRRTAVLSRPKFAKVAIATRDAAADLEEHPLPNETSDPGPGVPSTRARVGTGPWTDARGPPVQLL